MKSLELLDSIVSNYDLDELKTLIMRLDAQLSGYVLRYDGLAGNNINAKARELVLWCRRRDILDQLSNVLQSEARK